MERRCVLLFWNKPVNSKEYETLNKALMEHERLIVSLTLKLTSVEQQMQSLRGKFYQTKQIKDEEVPKDSYMPLNPFA